jgi:hypothetical protein
VRYLGCVETLAVAAPLTVTDLSVRCRPIHLYCEQQTGVD